MVERLLDTQEVAGSIPARTTNLLARRGTVVAHAASVMRVGVMAAQLALTQKMEVRILPPQPILL